jgi:hypothetical protein
MKDKLYLVTEIHYEYNDEIYHTPYDCSNATAPGEPVCLYRDLSKAQNAATAKNIDVVFKTELYGYGYDADEVFRIDLLDKLLVQNGFTECDQDDIESVERSFKKLLNKAESEMNQTLVDTLIEKVLRIKFFKVQEVALAE